MHWLVIYDICDPKRLRKVAKIMEAFGIRVQRSAFELKASRDLIENIRKRLKTIISEEDSVAYIPLCEFDYANIRRYGRRLFEDPDDSDEKNIFL